MGKMVMKLSIKALVVTSALLWGGCMLLLGVGHLIEASYGAAFLDAMSSVYPGFHASRTIGGVFVGTAYGLADGAIGGLIFGWLYNALPRE
jgi:hypothetical protein